jgi:integrase/recombinase XerD
MIDAVTGQAESAVAWKRSGASWPAPVEYAVAVDRYLASSSLGQSSRRVYRISLASWTWPLADRPLPTGRDRRGATPPVLPLAVLDDSGAGGRLAAALATRSLQADVRTINRELSALRSAVDWWLDMGWISRDPTAGLGMPSLPGPPRAPLSEHQLAALFRTGASLREQAFWHLLHDTGVAARSALALDASAVDRAGQPTTVAAGLAGAILSGRTAELLRWLLSGRTLGPLFLTERRAIHPAMRADVCPLSGRARMSYRRAAEIFTAATQPLDPAGIGWALHQLRRPRCATTGAR